MICELPPILCVSAVELYCWMGVVWYFLHTDTVLFRNCSLHWKIWLFLLSFFYDYRNNNLINRKEISKFRPLLLNKHECEETTSKSSLKTDFLEKNQFFFSKTVWHLHQHTHKYKWALYYYSPFIWFREISTLKIFNMSMFICFIVFHVWFIICKH